MGTERYCINDNDYIVLNALSESVMWTCVDLDKREEIVLKDDNGRVIIVLKVVKISVNNNGGNANNNINSNSNNAKTNATTVNTNINTNTINTSTSTTTQTSTSNYNNNYNTNINTPSKPTLPTNPTIIITPPSTLPQQQTNLPQPYYTLTPSLKIF